MEGLLRQDRVTRPVRPVRGSADGGRWRRRAWELARQGRPRRALALQQALVSARMPGGPRARLRDRFRLLRQQMVLGDWEGALANIEVLYGRLARRGILGGVAAGWVFWARATAQFHLGLGVRFRRSLATLLRGARRGHSAALRAAAFRLAAANAELAADPDRPVSPRLRAVRLRAIRAETMILGCGEARGRRNRLRWMDALASVPSDDRFCGPGGEATPPGKRGERRWTLRSVRGPTAASLPGAAALARWAQAHLAEQDAERREAVSERLASLAAGVREPWAKAALFEALSECVLGLTPPAAGRRAEAIFSQARTDLGFAAGLYRRLGWTERATRCERRWARLALPVYEGGVAEGPAAEAGRPVVEAFCRPVPGNRRPPTPRVRLALQEVGFWTEDPRVLRDLAPAVLLAPTALPVLILGESGTGKEVIARAVHRWSRLPGEFVPIHCGAIPRDLLESELFGHTRGAFTGAAGEKPGLIEAADQGTLFLDEIGEMGTEAQMKMLRVLENGEVRRLGDLSSRRKTIRLVAATHRDLAAEVEHGRFRLDLLHRVRGLVVTLRPLRERRGDIPLLAARFLAMGGPRLTLTSEAMAALLSYDWPGNVRELRTTIQRAAQLARAVGLSALPAEFLGLSRPRDGVGPSLLADDSFWEEREREVDPDPGPVRTGAGAPDATASSDPPCPLGEEEDPSSDPGAPWEFPPGGLEAHLESIERRYILKALDTHGWNRTRAARSLGDMSRTTLLSKMKRLGITIPEGEDEARASLEGTRA